MTAEQISELRNEVNRIGHVLVNKNGNLIIEAAENGSMEQKEALQAMARCWNELGALFAEVSGLAEDHARMTHTLQAVHEKIMYVLQGTARSEIAADWWQAADG